MRGSPSRLCDYKATATEHCCRLPEFAVPALDEVYVTSADGSNLQQRGRWWCYEHSEVMLGCIRQGPLAHRVQEAWLSAMRVVTAQVGERRERLRLEQEALGHEARVQELLAALRTKLENEEQTARFLSLIHI